MNAEPLLDYVRYLNAFLFMVLAVLAVLRYRQRRSEESTWAVAALTMIATITGLGYVLPDDADPNAGIYIWMGKLLIVLLMLFPYCLFRFASAFQEAGRKTRLLAAGLTATVTLATLALPRFPEPDEPLSGWFSVYLVSMLVQWAVLSGITAIKLWRGGKGKSTVARRRIRTLSVASAILLLAILMIAARSSSGEDGATEVVIQLLATASAVLFFIGFAPPSFLRRVWRRPEERVLVAAQLELMAATTPEEVTDRVLPHVAGILGGQGSAIVDRLGSIIGAHEVAPLAVRSALRRSNDRVVKYSLRSGALLIWTDAYTPFFGREELSLLESFTAMVDLALARCESIAAERRVAEDLVRANEELATARDAAMESSRLKSEFLATMSHEIRTPMTGVIGLTHLLLQTDLDQRQREYAEGVKGAGEALLSIINDILDFSKMEAERTEIEILDFNLHGLVDDTAGLLAETARGKGLSFSSSISADVPKFVRGDPARVRQVLLNLLSNAVKFTEQGGVDLEVELATEAPGNTTVRFKVTDTGIGVAAGDGDKLFEPFSQADASTTRRFGGTGLGLAISRQLVALMDGDIGFESESGGGSTFWFSVPVQESSSIAAFRAHDAPAQNAAQADTTRGRVLVVEDNKVNQLVALATIEQLGYAADLANNGLEALEALAQARYAAVLMDCQMPEMDGYTATRRIREKEGLMHRTPVIAMTAAAMQGDRERCIEAGMDDYICKPITPEEVEDALLRWTSAPQAMGSTG
ncbi:MAG TPA: ATP-binding protein [Actinomycetota bacterium]|nr:ATP-binding protein [Actinomycetota bacterium]